MAKTSLSGGASDRNNGLSNAPDDVVGLKNFKTAPLIGGELLRDFVDWDGLATKPATAVAENMSRRSTAMGALTAFTTGTLRLVHFPLRQGQTVTSLAFTTVGAGSGLTNQWFALFDASRACLAFTADDLTTAWGANTRKSLALTTPVTAQYTGLHYVGILVAASGMPTMIGVSGSAPLTTQAPNLGGNTTDTGLTAPPALPFTAGAIATTSGQMPYVAAG